MCKKTETIYLDTVVKRRNNTGFVLYGILPCVLQPDNHET